MQEAILKIKYFEKGLSQKPLKSQLNFFICTQSFFMNKIMKNKRGLEWIVKHAKKNSFFPFLVIYHLENFDD